MVSRRENHGFLRRDIFRLCRENDMQIGKKQENLRISKKSSNFAGGKIRGIAILVFSAIIPINIPKITFNCYKPNSFERNYFTHIR